LLKRHDCDVEICGGTAAAHYVSDLKEFSGIVFPMAAPQRSEGAPS
jgi:hypothetical protein